MTKQEMKFNIAIKLYEDALLKINKALLIFENSTIDTPEEFENLFTPSQGNETLNILQKEIDYFKNK